MLESLKFLPATLLQKEIPECAIKSFQNNYMIVNPGKFQSFIIERNKGDINPQ